MKKLFAGIVTIGLVLIVGGTTIFAAEHGRGRCFTDTDGDGICDNADSMCIYADEDGDGICDHHASGQGRGNGRGRGSRHGHGNGCCGGCVR